MKTPKIQKSKLILGTAAVLIIAAIITLGILIVSGAFVSDKVKVMKLLAQVPEKINQATTSEYVGFDKMYQTWVEKGGSIKITATDIQSDSPLLSEGTLVIDSNYDSSKKLANTSISLGEDTPKLICDLYEKEGGEIDVVLPEVLPETMLQWNYEDLSENESLITYVKEQCSVLMDKMTVDKIHADGKDGYRIKADEDTRWVIDVYGEDDQLTEISGTAENSKITLDFQLDFTDEDEQDKISLEAKMTYQEHCYELQLTSEDADNNIEHSLKLTADLRKDGSSFVSGTFTESIDSSDNSVCLDGELGYKGESLWTLIASGSIKDLNMGNSVTFSLGQVTLLLREEEYAEAAVDIALGTVDRKLEIPDMEVENVQEMSTSDSLKIKLWLDEKLLEMR
jgi:hypothetical protein